MPLRSGSILNKRYRIDLLLGQGIFSAVYQAWDRKLDTSVTLKEILNTDQRAVKRFSVEANLFATLQHPNLPYVIDHFILKNQKQYLVLEFVEGEALQAKLNRSNKGISEARLLNWMEPVCEAVAYLHSQNPPVLHGDIRPANIMVTPDRKIMLVDYGIGRQYDFTRTIEVGEKTQSLRFVAPESLSGQADERSDIYSLGATMYALLTRQTPVDGLQRQMGHALLSPRQYNSNISNRIEHAVINAMQISPEARFQNMNELNSALGFQVVSTHQVQDVPRTQIVERRSKPENSPLSSHLSKRNRRWLPIVAILFLVLCLAVSVIGGAGVFWYFSSQETAYVTQSGQELFDTATALAMQLQHPTETHTPQPSLTHTYTNIPSLVPTLSQTLIHSPSVTYTSTPKIDDTENPQATWQPCPGTYPSRLHTGDKAYVSPDPPIPNRVRSEPNAESAIVGFLQPDEKMKILEGPICSNEWIWWRVRSLSTGITGWTAEGDVTGYWLMLLP